MLVLAMAASLCAAASASQAQTVVTPMRIAEGPPGLVLVSDSRQDKIFAIDEHTLVPEWSFDVPGTPMAVGFAGNLVLIGNATTHNVEVYRLKGAPKGPTKALEFQFNLGRVPAGMPGTIQTPSDLAIDKDARLVFVVDSGERKVKVFDLEGNFMSAFPAEQATPMLSPTAIAVDPLRQEVAVSDYGDPNGSIFSGAAVSARIMVYTYGGQVVRQINGGKTNGVVVPAEAQFERPQGLCVDSQGRLYMAESVRGEVFVFDRDTGAVTKKLGGFGEGPGQLSLPLDLVMSGKSGDLLVTNSMLGRIEVLHNAGGLQ